MLIGGRFGRVESRRQAFRYLRGLLSRVERKNSWQLAEHAGQATPEGMQHLLNRHRWNADEVRDDLQSYVVEQLGDARGVVILDETGFAKKGHGSAGVQRQYSGTLGRIDNCQIGVFLAYASPRGRALIDRELYLPQSWTSDRVRCRAAGITDDVGFATKPELGIAMLDRAITHGVPFRWVTGDEVYGTNPMLRTWLETRHISYVLTVSCTFTLAAGRGPIPVNAMAAHIPDAAFERRSAGPGSKGPRFYDWAICALEEDSDHYLLVRRHTTTQELAFYLCYSTRPIVLAEVVRVAGTRWAIEECFQAAKNEVGLDQYQVRRYPAWYRHITLTMLAHAFLSAMAAHHRHHQTLSEQPELINLTVNEIRRLHATCNPPRYSTAYHLDWSHWRRRQQARARTSHYRTRLKQNESP